MRAERQYGTIDDAGLSAQCALRSHSRREAAKTCARSVVQGALDLVQHRLDVFPRLLYQPLPWLGRTAAGRAEGTLGRWRAIAAELDRVTVASALDVGCQAGFFTLSLGERGIPTLGVDLDPRSLRIAQHAARRAGVESVGWCRLRVGPDTVSLLPSTDVVLVLSVWHHWVFAYGLDQAGAILSALWDGCGRVLFFETGEEEMPATFGLPDMDGDPKGWLTAYLAERCPGSVVAALGRFKAFGVDGDEERNVAYRHLFAVSRAPSSP